MATTDPAAPPRYFVNAFVDPLIIGGASIAVYLWFRQNDYVANSQGLVRTAFWLSWFVNYPHFASTNFRLYHSRENIRQYPMTALVTPLLMLLAVIGSYASPRLIAPSFVLLYNFWSPYHFSGQTLGITMVYSRRTGFRVDGWLRRMWTIFIFSTSTLFIAHAQVGDFTASFYGVEYPSLGLPSWLPRLLRWAMYASGAAALVLLMWKVAAEQRLVPLMVILPSLTQFVWFAAPPAGQFSIQLVPFFHSLQYLFLAWSLQLKESLDRTQRTPSWRFVGTETVKWAAIAGAGGLGMFWVAPRIGSWFGVSLAFSTAIVFVAFQLHHFFVDGVIWRLRNPGVRSPLSSSLDELSGRRRVPVGATA